MTVALQPPPVGPPAEVRLPPSATTDLEGLRVVAVRRAAVPLVEVRLRVPFAGAEPDHDAAAALLAETLLAGTARRSRAEIAAALQGIGGSLSASADADRLAVGGSALARELPALLGILAEALVGAAYPDPEVEGERIRVAERVTVARSQPGRIARDALLARRYGSHPYGRELPEPGALEGVDAERVRALHSARVQPPGSVLVLVGDLDPEAALESVGAALGGWGGATAEAAPGVPPPPPSPAGPALLVDRPGAVQTTIRLAGPAPARADESYAAAKLANLVFGGYFSSRLVANIRERRGYTYSPRSSIEHAVADSLLTVAADVATEVTAPALVEIRYELGRIASLPVEPGELEAARRYAVGSLALSTATQAGLASTLAALLQVGLGLDYLAEHPRALEAVTVEEVQAAAQRMLAPTALVSVLLGDASATTDAVAAITPVVRG